MKILIIALSLISFAGSAFAAETVGEKASAKTNNVKREVKHKVNSVEEKICDKTDKTCFAEKAKNRTNETKDYSKDKAKEGKNVIDND
jgi:hypothetical protein